MKPKNLTLFFYVVFFVMLGITDIAVASTIYFDSLPRTPITDGLPIPVDFRGFHWSDNFWYLSTDTFVVIPSGFPPGTISSPNVALNAYGESVWMSRDELFTFNGAYLTGAWNDGLYIQVRGYSGYSLLYDQTVITSATAPTYFTFNYVGIDQLYFSSFGGTPVYGTGSLYQFVMDNFTYNEPVGPVVPIPATLPLLGTALVGLISLRIRLKK